MRASDRADIASRLMIVIGHANDAIRALGAAESNVLVVVEHLEAIRSNVEAARAAASHALHRADRRSGGNNAG